MQMRTLFSRLSFMLACTLITANVYAYAVRDVASIDRIFDNTEIFSWTHNLVDDGYQPGVDRLSNTVLTLELRDTQEDPELGWEYRPFALLVVELERHYVRIFYDDLVVQLGSGFGTLIDKGELTPQLLPVEVPFWVGKAILQTEITPGVSVPEPSSFVLSVLGLLTLKLRFKDGAMFSKYGTRKYFV